MNTLVETASPVAVAARAGLVASPRTLPPWLFYDEAGSALFEQITDLPEYYLTRTERGIFAAHAEAIVARLGPVTVVELGAGTATKTGLLLRAAARVQGEVLYQPVDVSPTALDLARRNLERDLPGVLVRPQVANYVTEQVRFARPAGTRVLALYIGSSVGNFSAEEAGAILTNLRGELQAGDALLLGTDLAPGAAKSIVRLLAAYDDRAGVTAAFNLNILTRLNRELGTDFDLEGFRHTAVWNAGESRVEMHLESLHAQTVEIPADGAGAALRVAFRAGETIHTENSHKFTAEEIAGLLGRSGFAATRTFQDGDALFAVTLATAV